jgi:hypothetical protein
LNYGAITVYATGSKGNVAPTAIISGFATGLILPFSIAVDSKGNIYVASLLTIVGGILSSGPNISVYPAGSEGDAVPTNVIAGANTGLISTAAVAVDSGQNIYAGGFTSDAKNAIEVFSAGSNGNVAPSATIVGADTGLNSVRATTLDADGDLYLANDGGGPTDQGSITVYSPGASGDAAPINTITSGFTGISFATGIAMDSRGKIYVIKDPGGSNLTGGSVLIFPVGSYATGAPASVIEGADTGLNFPQKVALDARGNISVLNSNNVNSDNVITVYPAGSAGDVTPDTTLNIRTGNLGASGIARGFDGKLYVADQGSINCNSNGQNCLQTSLGAIDIYPVRANGNASPGSVIVGHNTNLSTPSEIDVSRRGNIFVAHEGPQKCLYGCFAQGDGRITVNAAGSAGNALPIATIQGPHTLLHFPGAIAVDANENIYVVDGEVGGGQPFRNGFFTEGTTNQGLAMMNEPQGPGVWLLPGQFEFGTFVLSNDSILIFKAGSDGDTAPIATIHGPFTGLQPSGIAIGPSGH